MLLHLCASYVILVEKCVMRCGRCDSFRIGAFASATASNYLLTYFLSLIIFVSLLLIRTVRAHGIYNVREVELKVCIKHSVLHNINTHLIETPLPKMLVIPLLLNQITFCFFFLYMY